jgi:hypothetical protein
MTGKTSSFAADDFFNDAKELPSVSGVTLEDAFEHTSSSDIKNSFSEMVILNFCSLKTSFRHKETLFAEFQPQNVDDPAKGHSTAPPVAIHFHSKQQC